MNGVNFRELIKPYEEEEDELEACVEVDDVVVVVVVEDEDTDVSINSICESCEGVAIDDDDAEDDEAVEVEIVDDVVKDGSLINIHS